MFRENADDTDRADPRDPCHPRSPMELVSLIPTRSEIMRRLFTLAVTLALLPSGLPLRGEKPAQAKDLPASYADILTTARANLAAVYGHAEQDLPLHYPCAFSADGKLALSVSGDHNPEVEVTDCILTLWDVENGRKVWKTRVK